MGHPSSSSTTSGGTTTVDPYDNQTANVTISMSDYDKNSASNVVVVGTSSDDVFENRSGGTHSTVFGGAGNDKIEINATSGSVLIKCGDGNDTVDASYDNGKLTICGGAGNDSIHFSWSDGNNVVQYADGDGNDTVDGWTSSDTLYIEGSYTRETVGSDLIVNVGNGSIMLKGKGKSYYDDKINIETVPSGTFSSTTEPVAPSGATTTTGTASVTGSSYTAATNSLSLSATNDNQVISNYAGAPVTFSGNFTGANFSGNNFVVNSSAGTLTIQNVTDKVVDLRDASGNEFIKAYTPSTSGVIDGRGIAGYEIIYGSAAGADVIFAGDGGSQLWGGADTAADAIAGGNGSDIFIGGRFQGADVFYNASSSDSVNLTDASLSDIVAAVEVNGNIAIGFNTGNIITIQSTDNLSAAINLADNSSWRYNHVAKSWQSA